MGKATTGKILVYVDGTWVDRNPLVLGPGHHAVWQGSVVFDGARAFDGLAPDLDRHCRRVVDSALLMGLKPTLAGSEIEALAREGIERFPRDTALYICPMFYAEDGFVEPYPESTRFVLSIHESPLPSTDGFSACLSRFRRPARDMAPTDAKAACLYPNVARGIREARAKGFDVGVVLDPNGNVAEFSFTNLFITKDGGVHTPAVNGTFLNGVTRQRVITLLREDGVPVHERAIDYAELADADELFATGNYGKVTPCVRLDDRDIQPGPLFRRARELYFAWARRVPGRP